MYPMNMVGYRGQGVSGLADHRYRVCMYARLGEICERSGRTIRKTFRHAAEETNVLVNQYFWDGEWYARGITDDNVVFGISSDKEEPDTQLIPRAGRCSGGAADEEKRAS